MRPILFALLLAFSPETIIAERRSPPPADFEPLTSLPWKEADATLERVLNSIFREPSVTIRYPLLGEYLRTIPVEQLGKAFDICIRLEGTQTPNDLVAFFLKIWAKRDPQRCWKRTKNLFAIIGIENGWLNYDSWKKRDPITVENLSAIRASPFYLRSSALKGLPLGVDQSALTKGERVKIMTDFTQKWFRSFGSWPGYDPDRPGRYRDSFHPLESAFEMSIEQIRGRWQGNVMATEEIAFEIGLRRWLKAEPSSAIQVIKRAQETKWPSPHQFDPHSGPSIELLMLWAKADLPAMIRWAETLEIRSGERAVRVKGFLMSRVDASTRERWLAEAKSAVVDDDRTSNLMHAWAGWDPKGALEAAVVQKHPERITEVADAASRGPWGGLPYNTSHFGLGIIKDFDVMSIAPDIRETATQEWYQILEHWGDIDIGETARYGLHYLLRTDYAPRDRLIRFFTGRDEYPDEGGMIDRTFCALRVWAVVQPSAMKAWISTQKDPEMAKALTWLLENPWGTGAKE
ncbi:MAG: hypothetical protein M3463_03095 [Verrucomicrobiota bacterium]|nr:hypothetical protein [Verrucomicrobiota bacterium]